MNRSALIVICDFLLLSLLALINPQAAEDNQEEDDQVRAEEKLAAQQDIIEVLKLSLELEQENQQETQKNLELTREEKEAREAALAQTSQELDETRNNLNQTEEELEKIRQEREALEQAKAALAQAQREEESLRLKIQQELDAAQRERERIAREKAQAEERLEQTRQENTSLREGLARSETEKSLLRENLEVSRTEIALVREDNLTLQRQNEQLSSGVTQLAQTSTGILEEVRENKTMGAAEIFQMVAQRAERFQITWTRSFLLGDNATSLSFTALPVLDAAGQPAYLLNASEQMDWVTASRPGPLDNASLSIGEQTTPIPQMASLPSTPWTFMINAPGTADPVLEKENEPRRFGRVVLIRGTREYGEAPVEWLDTNRFRIDARFGNRLMGDIAAQPGDWVFSPRGRLIGIIGPEGTGFRMTALPSRPFPIPSSQAAERWNQLWNAWKQNGR